MNIINQQPQFATNNNVKKIKSKIKFTKMQHRNEELQKLRSTLIDEQKRLNELNREQEASSWLTAIPLSEEGYDLTKQLFWDQIRIRYGWTHTRLSPNCECGNKFDVFFILPFNYCTHSILKMSFAHFYHDSNVRHFYPHTHKRQFDVKRGSLSMDAAPYICNDAIATTKYLWKDGIIYKIWAQIF